MTADGAALIVIDVQRGFDDPAWGERDNPWCEGNVGRLLGHWREHRWPVVFVRHDSVEANSPLAPGTPGNEFKDVITGQPDLLVTKKVNSAFHGEPDLEAWLRGRGIDTIVICGISTNHCCETTARVGGNLGFRVLFCLDATHTFTRMAPDGSVMSAAELARATATNLHGEFAEVTTTAALTEATAVQAR